MNTTRKELSDEQSPFATDPAATVFVAQIAAIRPAKPDTDFNAMDRARRFDRTYRGFGADW